jgi:serpin B
MNDNSDWLETAFKSQQRPITVHTWPTAGEIRHRANLRHTRWRVGAVSGGLVAVVAAALLVTFVMIPAASPPPGPVIRQAAGPDGSVRLLASIPRTQAVNSQALSELSSSEQAFALDLTRAEVSNSPGSNVLLSPMSADIDLSMLDLGAMGQTQHQIKTTLQSYGLSADENAAAWRALVSSELADEPSGKLTLGNSLWVSQQAHVEPAFLRAEAASFGNDTYQVDFASTSATKAINAWVEQVTDRRITELFATGELSPKTAVVLANALHLHSGWAASGQFTTKQLQFVTAAGPSVSVPSLTANDDQLDAAITPSYEAVQIPLRGGRLAALAIEPTGSIGAWLDGLTPRDLVAVVGSLSMRTVDLSMPTLDLSSRPLLNTALSAMGMATTFEVANLSPMLGNPAGRRAALTKVQQSDTLQLNSGGIDAAASTGTSAFTSLVGTSIDIDHPYLLLVRDMKSGAILFSSVVNDPSKP